MNFDPGEGTSDGRVGRTQKFKLNSSHSEVTIKQEIKKEPTETAELIESTHTPSSTLEMRNTIEIETDSECGSDDQLNIENDSDHVKEEIKCEDEEEGEAGNGKKKSRKTDQSNGIDDGDRSVESLNIPSIKSNKDRNRQRTNGKAKAKINGKDRNRILTRKRNMAKPSKTRKVRPKPQKIHKCPQCNYTTSKKSNLIEHIRIHTGEKPFVCEICAKTFTWKSNLNQHKKVHRSQFGFHCSKCRYGFTNEEYKINHENKCKRRQYECHLCKKSSLQLSNLKEHMRFRHTEEKPFECSVCSKTFTANKDLGSHLRVHSKELPFDCQTCDRRFIDENEKQLHEKRCKYRRYECYICRYETFNKNNLKQHICYKHTGDKKFHCSICDKRFVHKGDLKRHLASHAKQQPFHCSKCLRQFKDEDVKMAHEKRCNRRHYQCYLCKNNYQNLKRLKFHQQKHHVQMKRLQS